MFLVQVMQESNLEITHLPPDGETDGADNMNSRLNRQNHALESIKKT
jgi:hypothetical protein